MNYAASFLLGATLTAVLAAPAPLPKPPPGPRDVSGKWQMRWDDLIFTAEFYTNGRYECASGLNYYVGTWKVEKGVLTLREWGAGQAEPADPAMWRVQLHRPSRGKGVIGMFEPTRTKPFRLAPRGELDGTTFY